MYNIKVSIKDMGVLLEALNRYTWQINDPILRKSVAEMNLNIGEQVLQQSESINAFQTAINCNLLSADPESDFFAGDYMYMGKEQDGSLGFKNRVTRRYVQVKFK